MGRKNGDGTWGKEIINGTEYTYFQKMYGYKPNGKLNRKTFRGRNKKGETARQEIEKKREAYEKSNGFTPDKEIKKQCFREYLYNYLYEYKYKSKDSKHKKSNVELTTFDGYIDMYKIVKKNDIGKIQIGSFNNTTKDIFQDFIYNQLESKSRATVKKCFIVMNMAIKQGVKDKNIAMNPLDDVFIPGEKEEEVSIKKKEIPFLQHDDRERLKSIAYECYDGKFYKGGKKGEKIYGINALAVIFIMNTGLSASELVGLKKSYIDMNNKTLMVETQIVKVRNRDKEIDSKYIAIEKKLKTNNRYRTIPLNGDCIKIINELQKMFPEQKEDDLLFINSKGNALDIKNIYRTLNSMLKKANCDVKQCGLHALRHSFGSIILDNASKNGKVVNLKTISDLLGHADISTTANIYLHTSSDAKIEAIEQLKIHNDNNTYKDVNCISNQKIDALKEDIKNLGGNYIGYALLDTSQDYVLIMDYELFQKENYIPMPLSGILQVHMLYQNNIL